MGIQERKEREREKRRQQIMAAAKRVFSSKGFKRTTIEDIAKEAELSPGTLYLYFKNKDDLYASLSLRILQYLLIRMEHVISERGSSVLQKMEALKHAMYDVYEFDPLILLNMFHLHTTGEILSKLSPELLSEIDELSSKSLEAMAEIMEEGIKKGIFINKKPSALSNILWSMFSGIVLWEQRRALLSGDKNRLKNIFDTAFEIFINGIKRQASTADIYSH